MEQFDIGSSLKIQSYLNNQTLDNDTLSFLETLKFKNLMTPEEKHDISKKVSEYKELEVSNKENPSAELSSKMQELAQDVMYSTGASITSLNLNDLKTSEDLDQAMLETNIHSKNDLYVMPDYDDYSRSSNYVKCKLVSHDTEYAYGIIANARMCITKSGKIITTKNALYMK